MLSTVWSPQLPAVYGPMIRVYVNVFENGFDVAVTVPVGGPVEIRVRIRHVAGVTTGDGALPDAARSDDGTARVAVADRHRAVVGGSGRARDRDVAGDLPEAVRARRVVHDRVRLEEGLADLER